MDNQPVTDQYPKIRVRRRRRKSSPSNRRRYLNYVFITLAGLLLLAALGTFIYFLPGLTTAEWGEDTVLVIGNQKVGEGHAIAEEREIYIKLETLQEKLDPHLYWDDEEKTAIITTEDRVVHMHSEELESEINLRPVELEFPLREKEDGRLFLPLLFLADFYQLQVAYAEDTDTVIIDEIEANRETQAGVLTGDAVSLRVEPSLRRPVLNVLQEGEMLRLRGEVEDGWMQVRTEKGLTGYLPERYIQYEGVYGEPPVGLMAGEEDEDEEEEVAEKEMPEHPFVMVWEDAYSQTNVDQIGAMPSLDIISPTWFHVTDAEGNLHNMACPEYVEWAHERDYLVWGLVTNSFDRELTADVLSSSSRRRQVIDQLLIYARLYDLDGINLDFENFHADYRDEYTQFARELAPLCREEGLVLSVDVTMITGNVYYSRNYDREGLAEAVDYVMLMAYDEHWAASPVAGSVASLPWVERGLQEVLEKVPPEQLVLGVPFYARKWTIEKDDDGEEEVSSRSFSMGRIQDKIRNRDYKVEWDESAGQSKAVYEYEDQDKTYKIWVEDERSMQQRIELVNRYNLAGIAGWRRGLEEPETWELIQEVLED